MPVPVTIDFVPPDEPDIAALRIYESATENGTYTQIERTTAVGTTPNWISRYVTALATTRSDWFAIAWENTAGEISELSRGMKGDTRTWVGEVVKRVMQRDSLLDERIVTQEAEAAIEWYLKSDPYADVSSATYEQLVGLTYLVLARSVIAYIVSVSMSGKSAASATIGLISFKNETSAGALQRVQKDLDSMIELSNRYLGMSTSFVMQLESVCDTWSVSSWDISRLIGWYGLT